MNESLQTYLNLSKKIAQYAGKIMLEGYNKDISFKLKGKANLVTEYDKKTEQFVIEQLEKAYSDHSILGEEGSSKQADPNYRWIIDPIDGTTNFAHKHPYFCISIGLEIHGEMAVGVVYAPMLQEMFFASKGEGSFLNDKKLNVSTTKLEESLLGTGFNPSFPELIHPNMKHYQYFIDVSQGIRRCGAAALDLCYTAAGRIDGFWELALNPWDMAAGLLIVQEAGGTVTNLNGSQFDIEEPSILATNGHIHQEMADYFASN